MTQRTVTVAHDGLYDPPVSDIHSAYRAALKEDGLVVDGEISHKVTRNRANYDSDVVVSSDTKESDAKPAAKK